MSTALIVLAAGQGTRMKSDLPKVLHRVGGAPLLWHALQSGNSLEPSERIVVTGYGAEAVGAAVAEFDLPIRCVVQSERLGTGHAVAQAAPLLSSFQGEVLVLYGDTPFISAATLQAMQKARRSADIVILGFEADDPARYGRLVTEGNRLIKIVEYKDATEDERQIRLCNSGVVLADAVQLFDLVKSLDNSNAAGEYYLTDIVALGTERGLRCAAVTCPQSETLGVDSRAGLAQAEQVFQAQARAAALDLGVTLTAPETVFFSFDTVLGRDVTVEPNVVFGPGVTVETGATIRAFSHLEGCHVSQGAVVGPYARLRPGAEIGEAAKVGNFVEVKNATLGMGAKANHLSYLGDASVGDGANIGAGAITCNYNGVEKFHTEIGARAFIGSNTMLVAPVSVGAEALTASGSVITKDVPDGALALARAEQVTRAGAGRRLFEMYKRAKEKRQKAAE